MWLILGFIVVIASTLGSFIIAGGNPILLLHVSEFVAIGGIGLGVLLVASPLPVLKAVIAKVLGAFSSKDLGPNDYLEMLKLLYEIFVLARRNGLISLEDHMMEPKNSAIFQKYPSFLSKHECVDFLCNGLKPLISGRIKPEQLESLLTAELETKQDEAEHPTHILTLVGDSLPGIGIIAAVLGIINTMSAIAEGPEAVGEKVAAALTGTFLGILAAYGFINPLTNRIKMASTVEFQFYTSMLKGVVGFVNGMPPLMAVEVARRALDTHHLPNADEMENVLKTLNSQVGK